MTPLFHPRALSLQRFADGDAPDGERARVAAHLARCTRCRGTVAFARGLGASLREVEPPRAPAHLMERVRHERASGARIILPSMDERAVARRPVWLPTATVAVIAIATAATLARFGAGTPAGDSARAPATEPVPTMHGMLMSVGILLSIANAQTPPAASRAIPSISGINGDSIQPLRMEYELTYIAKGRRLTPERGFTTVERATVAGGPALRIASGWRGHDLDRPETTYVERRSLAPLSRVARNIGPSRYVVTQRFTSDSLTGLIVSATSTHAIARALPAGAGPLLVGDAMALVLFQGVRLDRAWKGSAAIVGWGSAQADLLYPIELRVTGEESVAVPAGTFACWTIDVTAGRRTQRVWVRKSDQLAVMSRDSTMVAGQTQQVVLISAARISP